MTSEAATKFLSGRRILIVEDDPFISFDLQEIVEAAGAAVLGPVPSVQAALTLLGADRPDAALLDMNLRGEKSTPVVEALTAAGVPFILVTGYSRSQISEPALRDAPIVSKPIEEALLTRALERYVPTAK